MNSFKDLISKKDLYRHLVRIAKLDPSIDIEKCYDTTLEAIQAHKGAGKIPMPSEYTRLENHWYKSLEEGTPDYSVYGSEYFNTTEVWLCWIIYSRSYLKDFNDPKKLEKGRSVKYDLGTIKRIADLGCGMGYTTGFLKELFPMAVVTGTNVKDTIQYKLASELGRAKRFTITDSVKSLGQRDLIFASEYFEHFYEPIDHLEEVIDTCSPKALIVANAFTSRAIGHFEFYNYRGQEYPGKKMSRMWNDRLKDFGYEPVKTKFWNNRPRYWKKKGIL